MINMVEKDGTLCQIALTATAAPTGPSIFANRILEGSQVVKPLRYRLRARVRKQRFESIGQSSDLM